MSKKRLTYNDFRKYFSNNLENKDKHSFEQIMMQDAFDEEAYDGLSSLTAEELENDLDEIRHRIHTRAKKRKKLLPVWTWYAAGIAILATISVVTFNFIESNTSSTIGFEKPVMETMAEAKKSIKKEAIKEESPKEKGINESHKSGKGKEQKVSNRKDKKRSESKTIDESIDEIQIEAIDMDTKPVKDELVIFDEEQEIGNSGEDYAMVAQETEEEPVSKEEMAEEPATEIETDEMEAPMELAKVASEEKSTTKNKGSRKLFEGKFGKRAKSTAAKPQSAGGFKQAQSVPSPPNNMTYENFKLQVKNHLVLDSLNLESVTYILKVTFYVLPDGTPGEFLFESKPDTQIDSMVMQTIKNMGKWIPADGDNQVILEFEIE